MVTAASKCPYCGASVRGRDLVFRHHEDNVPGARECPGSRQIPRGPHDARPTWRDEERAGMKWDPYSPGFDPRVWAR